jgi:hypothetical protein
MKRTNTGQIGTGEIKKVKMLTGHEIPLDGDLLYVLESLYREVTLSRELKATFEEMMQEIVHLVEEMDEDARKRYLIESLFLNTVTYENERLGAYMRKLTGGTVHDEIDGPGSRRKADDSNRG